MFARTVAAVMALAVTGCSFAWSREPRSPCAQYYVVPVIDAAIAASAIYAMIDASTTDSSEKNAVIVVGALAAVGFGLSTAYGIRQVRRCERGT